MRTTRATIGALGAGLSLAVAASVVLLVVSSVIAFRGWPDDISTPAHPEAAALARSAAPVAGHARSASTTRALVLARPSHRSPGARSGHRPVASGGTPSRSTPATGPATSSPSPPTAGAPPASSGPGGSSTPAPSVGSTVSGATDQAASAVQQTTHAAANAVAPVAPAAAGALEQIGAAGGAAVSGAGQAAGAAVDGLLPPKH